MRTDARSAWALSILLVAAVVGLSQTGGASHTAVAEECPVIGGEGGFGGASQTCVFHCETQDLIGVRVESSDDDAKVKGSAECGALRAKCASVSHQCEAQAYPTKRGGPGTCQGESDEWWSSTLYVGCTSTSDGCIESMDPSQPRFCVGPLSDDGPSTTVELLIVRGVAVGQVCLDRTCTPLVPTCLVAAHSLSCWV